MKAYLHCYIGTMIYSRSQVAALPTLIQLTKTRIKIQAAPQDIWVQLTIHYGPPEWLVSFFLCYSLLAGIQTNKNVVTYEMQSTCCCAHTGN